MWVFKVFNIPQFVRHRSTNGNIFIIVLVSLFQILQTVPQNQNCFKNWNSSRHKTCSFTSEQSLMPLLFVQVKRNVCFTVKEYMHCSFVTDWSDYLLIKRYIFQLHEILSYMFGLLNGWIILYVYWPLQILAKYNACQHLGIQGHEVHCFFLDIVGPKHIGWDGKLNTER